MPRWRAQPVDHHNDSKFFEWLGVLMGQMIAAVGENDNVARAEVAGRDQRLCVQEKIGRVKIKTGRNAGKFRSIVERCKYCSMAGRKEPLNEDSGGESWCESYGLSVCMPPPHVYVQGGP